MFLISFNIIMATLSINFYQSKCQKKGAYFLYTLSLKILRFNVIFKPAIICFDNFVMISRQYLAIYGLPLMHNAIYSLSLI